MKVIIYCLAIVLAGCIGIYFLWNTSNDPGLNAGSFVRKTDKLKLADMKVLVIKHDFNILSGCTDQELYFTSHRIGEVIRSDWSLQPRDTVQFSIPNELSRKASNQFFTTIDSPYINFYANNLSAIIRCNIDNKGVEILKKPDEIFTRAVAIDSDLYLFRQGDKNTRDQTFSVWQQGSQVVEKKVNFLEVLGDGGIATDGVLKVDRLHNLYAYCYYYSNRFFIFDSSLSNVKQFRTIDSYNKFQVKAGDVENNSYTNVSPAVFVNCCISIENDLVYINSEVRAKNESQSQLRDSTVIDIYNMKSGEYLSSFYIPRINNERMSDLNVVGNKLIASFSNAVVTAKINNL
jgi:hypothetical protein